MWNSKSVTYKKMIFIRSEIGTMSWPYFYIFMLYFNIHKKINTIHKSNKYINKRKRKNEKEKNSKRFRKNVRPISWLIMCFHSCGSHLWNESKKKEKVTLFRVLQIKRREQTCGGDSLRSVWSVLDGVQNSVVDWQDLWVSVGQSAVRLKEAFGVGTVFWIERFNWAGP